MKTENLVTSQLLEGRLKQKLGKDKDDLPPKMLRKMKFKPNYIQ